MVPQTGGEQIASPLFLAGQWSGRLDDKARLILSYIGYIPGQGPVLNAQVHETDIPRGYVDETIRTDLLHNVLSDLGVPELSAYHGIVEKLDDHEILVAHFFGNSGFSAEKCLDSFMQGYLDRSALKPRFYRESPQGQILKTYVPLDGVVLAAPAVAPLGTGVEIERDVLGLTQRYERLKLMNALYHSVQASPVTPDVRLISV
jgi:hypothetical protein